VLVFPEQDISVEEQIDFTRNFGELILNSAVKGAAEGNRLILDVGNTGKLPVLFSPLDEHHDLEWHPDQIQYEDTARASLLYALEVPAEGGDTCFACTYSGYDFLDDTLRQKIDGLYGLNSVEGLHDYLDRVGLGHSFTRREQYESYRRPLVRIHPRTGRRALYFGSEVTMGVDGLSDADARETVAELTASATRVEHQYRHEWSVGDVVMWDNRRVLHAGTPFDMSRYRRHLRRTLVCEDTTQGLGERVTD